ncbi:MAG: GDP-mannose 4,6-dehydratase, partial [Muribaculaceae bacterium]|nr:GDP-mannose 4,6-dehydratase [Muribaculaceae bacterium]
RQPQSPYSATKIAADALALSFYNAFELPVTIVRPFNTYGPRQSARAIIPTIISQIASGERRIKVGDLTPTRDFNYVADTCRGFIALAKSDATVGLEVNIATGTEITMADTLATIARLMGADVEWVRDPQRIRPSGSEVFRLCGDNSRIRELTGWHPEVDIEEGLRRTIEWFTDPANLALYKAGIYNV